MANYLHQERYAKRQKDRRGQVQVKVWVLEEHRDELKAKAKKLRNPRYKAKKLA